MQYKKNLNHYCQNRNHKPNFNSNQKTKNYLRDMKQILYDMGPLRPGKSCKLHSSGKFRILQCPQNSMIRVKGQRETCASNLGVA